MIIKSLLYFFLIFLSHKYHISNIYIALAALDFCFLLGKWKTMFGEWFYFFFFTLLNHTLIHLKNRQRNLVNWNYLFVLFYLIETSLTRKDSALSSATDTNEYAKQIRDKDEQIQNLNNQLQGKNEEIQQLVNELKK